MTTKQDIIDYLVATAALARAYHYELSAMRPHFRDRFTVLAEILETGVTLAQDLPETPVETPVETPTEAGVDPAHDLDKVDHEPDA